MNHRTAFAASGLALCLALLSCSRLTTKIGDIQKNPERYENRQVWVQGTVTASTKLPFMDEGFYTLADSTGEITVVTGGALPAQGSKRIVRGTVQSQFKLFGKSAAVAIREDG
jgi:hypothetical protein